ncbi:MAG: hypothetical protein AAF960_08610, partial [Bacteroidota bacterium]
MTNVQLNNDTTNNKYFLIAIHLFLILISISQLSAQSYAVEWINTNGLSVNGNTVTKTVYTSWNTGKGRSENELSAGQDGWAEMTMSAVMVDLFFGFTSTPNNLNWTSINYAIHCGSGNVYIYENGASKAPLIETYGVNDVLRAERVGNTVYYKKNGSTFYTSQVASTSLLTVQGNIYQNGASISNATVSFPAPGQAGDTSPPTAPTNLTASNVTQTFVQLNWTAS